MCKNPQSITESRRKVINELFSNYSTAGFPGPRIVSKKIRTTGDFRTEYGASMIEITFVAEDRIHEMWIISNLASGSFNDLKAYPDMYKKVPKEWKALAQVNDKLHEKYGSFPLIYEPDENEFEELLDALRHLKRNNRIIGNPKIS